VIATEISQTNNVNSIGLYSRRHGLHIARITQLNLP